MLTARLIVGNFEVKAFVPYGIKDIPKSFPGKQSDPSNKCWILPVEFVDELADTLRVAGAVVFVTGPDGTPWRSGKAHHGHRATPATGWADALFVAVGPDRVESVFRALAKALHPDVGSGDTVLMRELIAGRERAAFSRRAAS